MAETVVEPELRLPLPSLSALGEPGGLDTEDAPGREASTGTKFFAILPVVYVIFSLFVL